MLWINKQNSRHCFCLPSRRVVPAAASKRYAIIGGGFAGVAVAHHLSLLATATTPVILELFDLAGLVRGPTHISSTKASIRLQVDLHCCKWLQGCVNKH